MNIFEDTAPRSPRPMPRRVAVLGCSGSIGSQTLDVCRQHPDKLTVSALSVDSSTDVLVEASREFRPEAVVVADPAHGSDPVLQDLPQGCALGVGPEAAAELACLDSVDVVVIAVVGEAAIRAAHTALKAGKVVACANKEVLVSAGDLLMAMAEPGRFLPIDSEHSAIYQCLVGEREREVAKLWITCSGGPFRTMDAEALSKVTAAEALAHPTWTMGPKITIDSATLMNKGLEVIEAHHLFAMDMDRIAVVVHPQSTIHSMVQFVDGSVKAQLGPSDMRIPIQYALSYPERWDAPCEPLDFTTLGSLTFEAPDVEKFRCLALAYEAGRTGGTLPCAMNAANEVANAAFRAGGIGFTEIARCVERVMDTTAVEPVTSIEQIGDVDALARREAERVLRGWR